jgi:hypothetical protein
MVLEQNTTISRLESLYQNLGSPLGAEISPSVSYTYAQAFGLEAALIQFIATWQRANSKGKVIFDCEPVDYADLVRRACLHPSNVAACYFGEVFANFSDDSFSYSRSAALNLIEPILNAMYREDFGANDAASDVALLCYRNHPKEYLPSFYELPAQGNVRSKDQFQDLVQKILRTKAISCSHKSSLETLASSLGPLLHELIKNTDEHSLTDEDGNFYQKGVRGLIIKFAALNRSDLLSGYAGNNPRLTTYLNGRLGAVGRDTPQLTFLEVSVIDTGPGLARRWLSKKLSRPVRDLADISIDEERDAVVDCFKKYMTTKPSESSGMGLTAVLDHLQRLKGFLRLRTGRLSLFQALDREKSTPKFSPLDWDKNLRMLPEATGTAFTICFPIATEGAKN